MFILKACDPNLMPSFPQHRNLKRKSDEPMPQSQAKHQTDDRYIIRDILFQIDRKLTELCLFCTILTVQVVHWVILMAINSTLNCLKLIEFFHI